MSKLIRPRDLANHTRPRRVLRHVTPRALRRQKYEAPPLMIAIIDYQMGNLRSVQKGFERVGHEAIVTGDAAVTDGGLMSRPGDRMLD